MITVTCRIDTSQARTQKQVIRMIQLNDRQFVRYYNKVRTRAYRLCPYKSGQLRDSIYKYSHLTVDNANTLVWIHFEARAYNPDNDFEYGYIQHEDPTLQHKAGTSFHFLRIPFEEETQDLLGRLQGVTDIVWQ